MLPSKWDTLAVFDIALFEYNSFEWSIEAGDPDHENEENDEHGHDNENSMELREEKR